MIKTLITWFSIYFSCLLCGGAQAEATEVAITMDDFNTTQSILFTPNERNERVLKALAKHGHLKVGLFVKADNVANDSGKALLSRWGSDGHMISNHTYSHKNFNDPKVSYSTFSNDFVKADLLLQTFKGFQKFFRYPYLHEGETIDKREAMRTLLSQKGYRNGYVTIDTSDWYISSRLEKRILESPKADLSGFRDYYLRHIWDRAQFYNKLAKKVLGHEVKHTLLVHFNVLNALFLDDLLKMFEERGWKLIDAVEAYKDPLGSKNPNTLPAGQSLIWAMAKETGRFDSILRYPGEDGEYEKDAMDKLGL
jgi:peptidoglycan/xylan/chitin deacetylase (PgdA/CDA1 family)